MFYQFPVIRNISDVLPAIEGASEFLVADRGDHITINYMVNTPTTFPPVNVPLPPFGGQEGMLAYDYLAAIRRECRGMIFDKATGDILRRPYHKFFNVGQVDETQPHLIDLSEPHYIMEKLDGSMIVPYRVNGRVIFGTKMGDTDVCTPVDEFVRDANPFAYMLAFEVAETYNTSLIFEWMSRKQRIVIDHPEDTLVLTAMRNKFTGEYVPYEIMEDFAADHQIPVVQRLNTDGKTIHEILEHVRTQEGTEGVVIRYHNGHMLKIKSEWYLKIHGAKDAITEEKNVVQMIIDSTLDDAKALVLEEDRKNLDRYEGDFWDLATAYSWNLTGKINEAKEQFADRKDFAINGKPKNQYHRSATFAFFDEAVNHPTVLRYVIEKIIRPALSTRTKYGVMKSEVLHGLRQYV